MVNLDNLMETFIEIEFDAEDKFNVIRETLTRIGIPNFQNKTLYQSCHIFHKRGRYYLVHFKEMFGMDGGDCYMTEDDIFRKNKIATIMQDWGMLRIINGKLDIDSEDGKFKVIKNHEKNEWDLQYKYKMGVPKQLRV